MIPGNGIETLTPQQRILRGHGSFKSMIPGNGIETTVLKLEFPYFSFKSMIPGNGIETILFFKTHVSTVRLSNQ